MSTATHLTDESASGAVLTPVHLVPTRSLRPGDSPRLEGVSQDHVATLAEAEDLPPILVHHRTMRVIDGEHRLQAALLRGDEQIQARFFDGNEVAAFVVAVEINSRQGLPLSLPDRVAAATRILRQAPQWSDRAVARITGLSGSTVGGIREREIGTVTASRLGRDGRVRPVNAANARRAAAEIIVESPDASLRDVARRSGVSVGTARDVRRRIKQGEDPVPPGLGMVTGPARTPPTEPATEPPGRPPARTEHPTRRGRTIRDTTLLLERLRKDPSLRFSEEGRGLLRWLGGLSSESQRWGVVIDRVPDHVAVLVAELARGCANTWNAFADELERREERERRIADSAR